MTEHQRDCHIIVKRVPFDGQLESADAALIRKRDGDHSRQDDEKRNEHLGIAPMSGVRRAADMEFAAIARWTTRKFVHQ